MFLIAFFIFLVIFGFWCRNRSYRIKDVNAELRKIDNMNGLDFEQYVANLLKQNGYNNVQVTKSSGDYGVDITAWLDGEKVVFQCKRYKNNIGLKPIQEVYAGKRHYNADIAIVVTNSYFTQSAIQLAKETDVVLWDRGGLTNLIRNCIKETKKNPSGQNNRINQDEYANAKRKIDEKLKNGIKAHSKHIPCENGMKEYVRMYRHCEMKDIIELVSEPFDSLQEAQHFADCFNDNFLYDAYCKEKDGKFYVYSGWLIKFGFISYSISSKGEYFEFANWS